MPAAAPRFRTSVRHRWALRQFLGWCENLAYRDPAAFTRGRLEAYELFLFRVKKVRPSETTPK